MIGVTWQTDEAQPATGIRQFFDLFETLNELPGVPSSQTVPAGLADYAYARARAPQNPPDARARLDYFMRAVLYRPRGWPPSFYGEYLDALHGARDISAADEVRGKLVPITASLLRAVSTDSWASIDLGLPVRLQLYWTDPEGREWVEELTSSNLVPNGGFDLGRREGASPAAWVAGADARSLDVTTERLPHEGRDTLAVALRADSSRRTIAIDSRLIPLDSNEREFLWSAWIQAEPGANPHIFVHWFDAKVKPLGFDLPFQGGITEHQRHYAGVLQAPADARFMQLRIANFLPTGRATIDDVLVVPIRAAKAGPDRSFPPL